MRLVLIFVALFVFAAPAAGYTPQVREARAWARTQINHGQWRCLHVLWEKESSWRVHARYPKGAPLTHAAYGIPQFYPGLHLFRVARDDAKRQVRMGLRYIWSEYGTPCHARRFQRIHRWY